MLLAVPVHAAPPGKGVLFGSVAGDVGSPREGDVKWRDAAGRWYTVQGIPASSRSFTSTSPTVAVIDSGILADQPQIKSLIADTQDFTGEGMTDRIGHGTLVSIILLAPFAALPPDKQAAQPLPRIIEAKVANADGSIRKADLIAAIQWAAQHGAEIVNLSLGFREGTDDYSDLCYVIQKLPDVLFVAAAGNFGPSVKVFPASCQSDNVLSVGAANPDGSIARYSGTGQVVAPGTVILVPPGK